MVSALDLMASYEKTREGGLVPAPSAADHAASVQRMLMVSTSGALAAYNEFGRRLTAQLGVAKFDGAAQGIVGSGQTLASAMAAAIEGTTALSGVSARSAAAEIAAASALGFASRLNLVAGSTVQAALDRSSSTLTAINGLADAGLGSGRIVADMAAALQPTSFNTLRSLGFAFHGSLLDWTRQLARIDSFLSELTRSLKVADAVIAKIGKLPFPTFPAGTDEGDLERLQSHRLDDAERYAAAQRMAARIPWNTGLRPGVDEALVARARADQRPVRDVIRDELATAIYLATGNMQTPQYMRFGPQWMTNKAGKKMAIAPDDLPIDLFYRWLRIEAIRIAEASLLETPEDEMPAGFFEEVPELIGPELDPLHIVIAGELDPSLLRVLELASPRQRELIALLWEGLSRDDAARTLGIARSTVDAQLYRLRQKLA